MSIRGLRALAGLSAAALVMTACGGSDGDGGGGGSDSGDGENFRIGVSFYSNVIPLYVEMEEGMRDKAEELAFTMLTTEPGPDIAPYHDRQVVVLKPGDWAHWLFLTKPESELLRPLPKGSLEVETVRPGAK